MERSSFMSMTVVTKRGTQTFQRDGSEVGLRGLSHISLDKESRFEADVSNML